MKTIVTGPKNIQSYDVVSRAIDSAPFASRITHILTSQEPGPPIFGYRWAVTHKIPIQVYRADWKAHGKPAGIIRDREMATFCDAAVVVWDGVDWMSAALLKYFRGLDPKVEVFTVVYKPENTPQTLVNQGRDESYVVV